MSKYWNHLGLGAGLLYETKKKS